MQIIKLNIVSLDLKTGDYLSIDDNGNAPCLEYIPGNLFGTLDKILSTYTELNPGWVECILYKAYDDLDNLVLEFFCIVPEKIKLKCGSWIKVDNYELIQEVQRTF